MEKSYEIKIYSRLGKYKKTINPQNIVSEISFSEEINGGQGEVNLDIIGSFSDFEPSDIVEIREACSESYTIGPTFTGIIEEIHVTEYMNHDQVSLDILGLFTALSDIFYKEKNMRKFSKNEKIGNIFREIIDQFNEEYGDFSQSETQNLGKKLFHYTKESIPDDLPNIFIEIDNTNYLDVMNKAIENTDISFFIDATGLVTLRKNENFNQTILTMGREAISYTQSIKKRDLCNTYYLTGDNNIAGNFSENASIEKFGKKEKSDNNSDLKNQDALNQKGTEFIKKKAFPSSEISVIIKPQSGTKKLFPGMNLTLQNIRNPLQNQQITKIEKNPQSWTLFLGDFPSFGKIMTQK